MVAPEFSEPLVDTVAKEGQPHQLACRVTGQPLPDVSWFKDGTCVDTCRDYCITFNNGLCTLSFQEVFIEDQAEFSCRAANPVGDADTCAKLVVERNQTTSNNSASLFNLK